MCLIMHCRRVTMPHALSDVVGMLRIHEAPLDFSGMRWLAWFMLTTHPFLKPQSRAMSRCQIDCKSELAWLTGGLHAANYAKLARLVSRTTYHVSYPLRCNL